MADNFERECWFCKKPFVRSKSHIYGAACSHECMIEHARMIERQVKGQDVKPIFITPSLKDFIGKECTIFDIGVGSSYWQSGQVINDKLYNYLYMGSDDACHIIQRKIYDEPDGIFFFPKAAVALRF